MGLAKERGGIWWNNVPASRCVRIRHRKVGGEEPCDMMDFVGQLLYPEMVWMCVMGMCPM
jgi:hypothetical protein